MEVWANVNVLNQTNINGCVIYMRLLQPQPQHNAVNKVSIGL